jgi:hypothetical protein
MRRALDKIPYTPELKEHYKKLQKWMEQYPEIEFKKLHPFGLQINVGTIPDEAVEEFLIIANSVKI